MSENGKVMQQGFLVSQRYGNILVAGSLAVAILTSFLAIWGLRSSQEAKQQANVALARQLVSQAQSINAARSSQQLIAVLLATQSMNMFPSSEAAQLLMNNNFAAHAIAQMTHYHAVSSVAFSPDGRYVVSGSYDHTARVWEASTGREVARITHDGPVYSTAFSPDGRYVISGGGDTTARIWAWQPDGLISNTCADLPRNLSRAEWSHYIGDSLSYQAVCLNLPIEPEMTATP